MEKPVKIIGFEAENVKRIQAVALEPSSNGLTVIGGNNGNGKTSILDAICYALGGERRKPTSLVRDGAESSPYIKVVLSNGLIVERSGKNSSLKVTDSKGLKGGQQLLNSLIEELALDLPKFMATSSKDKAAMLLKTIGVQDELEKLEQDEARVYAERRAANLDADRKKKLADGLPFYPDAPAGIVSTSDLIRQYNDVVARNAQNVQKRQALAADEYRLGGLVKQIAGLEAQLTELRQDHSALSGSIAAAKKEIEGLHDEPTEEIARQLRDIDAINACVRDNQRKEQADREAAEAKARYAALDAELSHIRCSKVTLLNDAKLPLDGLSIDGGELVYNGKRWDCMSGSEQMRVATAVVRASNPNCGFVLLDKGEQMDANSLAEFGRWLETQGMQAIMTRVSTGTECTIIIEDGMVRTAPVEEPAHE